DLAMLARWQRKIAAQPGVRAVIGPGRIARRTAPLQALATKVADEEGSVDELDQLGPGLRRAAGAVGELRHGLDQGAAGSGLLVDGSNRAATGAGTIDKERRRAAQRGEVATNAIERLEGGTQRLADGQRRASVAGLTLTLGLRSLLPRVRGGELARARKLARQLEIAAAAHPALRSAASGARVVARAIGAH